MKSRSAFAVTGAVCVAAAATVLAGGCSILTASNDFQCESNAQCAQLADTNPAFLGSTCGPEGVCVASGTNTGGGGSGGSSGCVSATQCTSENNGVPSICRELGGECTRLLNEDCTDVVGDHTHPDVLLIGVINTADFGAAPDIVQHINHKCLAEQVVEEITSNAGGIPHPSGSGTRPVAFVLCNEKTKPSTDEPEPDQSAHLDSVGEFMINELGIKTLVGGTFNVKTSFEANVVIPNGAFHIIPSVGLPAIRDLNDPDMLVWSTVPNYANTMHSIGDAVQAAEEWLRTSDPPIVTDRIRVAVYANQDGDTQMAEYAIDTDRLVINGLPVNSQDPDGGSCPNGCFKYLTSSQFEQNGEIQYSDITTELVAFNPHIFIILDTDSGYQLNALPDLELLDTDEPPIYFQRSGDPSTTIFLQSFLDDPPNPGAESRFYSVNYQWSRPALQNQWELNFGATCPAQVPPNAIFFPPFLEFTYDAMHMAVMANLANGNWQKFPSELTGAEISAGFQALAPIGHEYPDTATPHEIKGTNLLKIYNDLVAGTEIDIAGVSGELDLEPEWKSPIMDMDVVCVDPGDEFPTTAEYGPSGVVWDFETDVLLPGPARSNFDCLPLTF